MEDRDPTRAPARDHRAGAADDAADLQTLAQDWIAVWQSEIAAAAADREVHEAWQSMAALWAGAAGAMLRALPRSQPHDGPTGGTGTAAPARAAPAAAAPDPRDAEIQRLGQRLADLERRLADLERGGG